MNEDILQELDRQLARLADGDRSASSAVFAVLWPRLVAFAERSLGRGPDADDAAQQALEKVFAQAGKYDRTRSALAWALAITAWECRTLLARRQRRKEDSIDGAAELAQTVAGPEEQVIRRGLSEALDVAVAGLSEEDRRTLKEAFFDETEGTSAPAFRKRKQRTLERLRGAWRRLYGSES